MNKIKNLNDLYAIVPKKAVSHVHAAFKTKLEHEVGSPSYINLLNTAKSLGGIGKDCGCIHFNDNSAILCGEHYSIYEENVS